MSELRKVVLITGCSEGGIGFHLCQQFAEEGCKVYATARRLEAMKGFTHASIETLALDVTSDDDVQRIVQTIMEAEGRIDIVVNNAGTACIGPAIDIPLEQVKMTFDTNTFASLRLAKAVIPHMAVRKTGLIVNVGSVVGDIPTPWHGVYCASKAALHSITEILFMECKPFNIDVMLVAPGAVKSHFSDNQATVFSLPEDSLYKSYLDQIIRRMYASQQAGSMPTENFAKLVVKKALSRNPPSYAMIGGTTTLFALLKWAPRAWVLYFMWKSLSRK